MLLISRFTRTPPAQKGESSDGKNKGYVNKVSMIASDAKVAQSLKYFLPKAIAKCDKPVSAGNWIWIDICGFARFSLQFDYRVRVRAFGSKGNVQVSIDDVDYLFSKVSRIAIIFL